MRQSRRYDPQENERNVESGERYECILGVWLNTMHSYICESGILIQINKIDGQCHDQIIEELSKPLPAAVLRHLDKRRI